MSLREELEKKKFVVTAEVGPAKGIDIHEFNENADLLKGKVAAVNCTDQQSAVMRLGSLAACLLLKQKGIEPVFQMTCRDRNRIALQSDLLSAAVLGIENVLALTGDYVTLGDHLDAKPVFDLDSVSLLLAAKELEQGRDLAGKELKGVPKFFLGASVTPGADPVEPQLIKMEKKAKAGAQFFQTQAVYEPKQFEAFMKEAKKFGVPVLVGIVLIRSAAMARFMNRNVAGIHVPDELIEEMDKAEDKAKKSIEIAARLIKEMKDMCQGAHIMAIGLESRVPAVIQAAGL
ncbi:MAG: 5,10-methylenetetrahydrofolate reductase [Chloroflexi bacterium]|nr:5,10-methylenetetrahydrofolate reductase [Chloroflexota bacterium]MBM3173070.1 5,10-methylenetetrahydrofolate reductase [Chloroflexota bacterium]MBM3174699.1 5,10-methylenetetrahydrofolate reductase [Chloroflexota bacterium]MBM4450773.1 5,10-methylenetetrahydrofolate reductase [Chloroflexota bacterium]